MLPTLAGGRVAAWPCSQPLRLEVGGGGQVWGGLDGGGVEGEERDHWQCPCVQLVSLDPAAVAGGP